MRFRASNSKSALPAPLPLIASTRTVAAGSPAVMKAARSFAPMRGSAPYHADNLAALPDHLRHQYARVARAAANLQHAHSWPDSGLVEEPLRDRIDQSRLLLQAVKLFLRVAQGVFAARIDLVGG